MTAKENIISFTGYQKTTIKKVEKGKNKTIYTYKNNKGNSKKIKVDNILGVKT